MKRILILSILLICFHLTTAQVFEGFVLDAKSAEPLAYANIHVLGKNLGGISYRNGQFKIQMATVDPNDSIKVSYLGYESRVLPVSSLDFSIQHQIKLNPGSILLEPIEILSDVEYTKLGNTRASGRHTGWGDFESLRGRTKGLLITGAECPNKVRYLNFRINHNDWDSVAFRLNIMEIDGDKPGRSILNQNIIYNTDQSKKWIKVDLGPYNITICKEAIVTIEWVDAWGLTGEFSNLLTISLSKMPGPTFSREPGEELGTLTIQSYTPSFYLEVY